MDEQTASDRSTSTPGRRVLVITLVVVATLGCLTFGSADGRWVVRAGAAVVAGAAGTAAIVLARRRSSVVAWLVVTAALALLRLVREQD